MSDYPSKTSFLSSSLHASSSSSSLSSSSSSSIIEDRKSFQALQGVVARQLAREQAVMGRKQQLLDSILVIGSTGARGGVGGGGGVSENQSPASRRPPPPAPPPPTATTATAAALLQRPMYGPQQKPEASSLHPSHYLFSSDQGEVVEVVTPLGGAGGEMLRSKRLSPWPAKEKPFSPTAQQTSSSSSTASSATSSPRRKKASTRKLPSLRQQLLQQQMGGSSAGGGGGGGGGGGRGLMKSVDVLRLDDEVSEISVEASPASEINDQLVHDVTVAFNTLYANRHARQAIEERQDTFVSRIPTPPDLINDDHTAYRSRLLYNDLLEDFSVGSLNTFASLASSTHKKSSLGPRSTAILNEIQSGYTTELSSFSSVALFVQARYLEMKNEDKGNRPSQLKASFVSDLALTLCKALGRYSQLMEPLLWELFNSIFLNFAALERRWPHEEVVSHLQEVPTYFAKYHETLAALEDANAELGILQKGSSMRDLVKKFQTVRLAFDQSSSFIRDACFNMWKKYTLNWRKIHNRARIQAQRYRWRCWKVFMEERHLHALEEYSAEIERKLARVLQMREEWEVEKNQKGTITTTTTTTTTATAAITTTTQLKPAPSFKIALPKDEKATSMRKYLQRLSKYVSDRIQPIQEEMMEAQAKQIQQLQQQQQQQRLPFSPMPTMSHMLSRQFTAQNGSMLHPVSEDMTTGDMMMMHSSSSSMPPPLSLTASYSSLSSSLLNNPLESPIGQLQRDQSISRWHQLKVSANMCQEKMTQTPDYWMEDIPESAFSPDEWAKRKGREDLLLLPHLPSSQSSEDVLSRAATTNEEDLLVDNIPRLGVTSEEGLCARVDLNPKNKYQLSVDVAIHLISFVYESKFADIIEDITNMEFNKIRPFLEYIKELFNARYRIRRLSNKFFRGLIACCIRNGAQHRRLELFGQLCGLSLVKMGENYDPKRCHFFFSILYTFYGSNLEEMMNAFQTSCVLRQFVIDKLPIVFNAVEKYEPDLYEAILFEIIDLPCVDPQVMEIEYKVNLDEVLCLFMEYYDVELDERESHKLRLRREQMEQERLTRQSRRPRRSISDSEEG